MRHLFAELEMRKSVPLFSAAGWVALSVCAGLAYGQTPSKPGAKAAGGTPSGLLSPQDARTFEERFAREIWPLLERQAGGCVSCHNTQSPSQLRFGQDGAGPSFRKLLVNGFLEPDNPSGLLARVTSPVQGLRMPPHPAPPWAEGEIEALRSFVTELYDRTHRSGPRGDEMFPPELQEPYRGKPSAPGMDNTFLTYRQLRGKIKTLFGDDWKRSGRDLFQENVAQFGGADFVTRFDETSKPSAPFLSALDTLGRDVASRSYLAGTGPFAGRPASLPSPVGMKAPSPPYRREIARLYRRLLFRAPSEQEQQQAFRFIRGIYAAAPTIARGSGSLDFELTVEDGSGSSASRELRLQVSSEPLGLYQEWLDQSTSSEEPQVRKKLEGTFLLKPGTAGQRLEIRNDETRGNVSIAAVELKGPLPAETVRRIPVTDPSVVVQGAWTRSENGGFTSFEDGDANKGSSRIEIPLAIQQAGRYEATVVWRRAGTAAGGRRRNAGPAEAARAVLVEVLSHGPARIANPPVPAVPPPGEARFFVDQTIDNIAFWNLDGAYRFGDGPDQGVEINNSGTKRRVVADAAKFLPPAGGPGGGKEIVIDDPQAEGEKWPPFRAGGFRPYNQYGGASVMDDNQRKGEMKLLYRPARSADWQPSLFYRLEMSFPGKADNEPRAPVIVRARESTPIIQVSAPVRVQAGAPVTLDASATYNVQRSDLKFTWRQTGGPKVTLNDPHAAKLAFRAEAMSPQQAAWEGLCLALMKHPDFLFTRPRSLAQVKDPKERRRLQLVKVAQDLVARPPTEAEVRLLESGTPLAKLVDRYLESQEFRDFYFHRIRLVLESRGSREDDEPVRLWSYVAFNDRPFKEILTADYSVDENMRRQERPAYHGKTGLLTMKGFIKGKPGLPHYNYAAIVTEKFLGYVYEVPPSIVMMREGITAVATTSPSSACYSCHKVLTPLAHQRLAWDDDGNYLAKPGSKPVDDTDRALVPSYPYRGKGMEAFAVRAVNKERFIRTMLQTHFVMFFGREMRYQEDERALYRRLWDAVHAQGFSVRGMLRTLMASPEYLDGRSAVPAPARKPGPAVPPGRKKRPRLATGARPHALPAAAVPAG